MRYVPTPPAALALAPMPVLPGQPGRSTWHSPVLYLFGGLAAMLVLIFFALLILACSYWRISGLLDPPPPAADDGGGGGGAKPVGSTEPVPYSEGSFVVVMAGDRRPTFLATPSASRASSFVADDDDGKVTGNVVAVAGEQQL